METLLNPAKLCFITACLLQIHLTYAITVTPLDPILAVGSNVNITCALSALETASYTAADIIWEKNFVEIDSSLVNVLSDSEAMISLQNLTMADDGANYYCYFPNFVGFVGTSLHVGSAPTSPTLQCFSTTIVDYWCEWSEVKNTNLILNYTFHFEYPSGTWNPCPDLVNYYKCKVPMSDGDGNTLNPGVRHQVRVIVQNYLGKATTQQYFSPDMEAVPLPPNVETIDESQTTLTIRYTLQEDLGNYAKSSLRYHIRYSSSDSPNDWIKDSDLNNRNEELTISGLEYYTWYNLQARAKFSGGSWSEWGPVTKARTDQGAPEGAVNFTVKEVNVDKFVRDILLHWTRFPEKDLNGKLLGYFVTLWGSDSERIITEYPVDENAISYTISDQTNYEQFYVSVVANSSVGHTRHDKVQILDKSKEPGKPTSLDGEVLSWNSINISWRIPDEPGSLTLMYQLECELQDGSEVKSETIISNAQEEPMVSYLVTDLEAYTEYTFKVRAQNEDGYGKYSEDIKRTTFESVPGSVSILSVNAVEENSTLLRVSWSGPEQANGVITKYEIYYHQYSNGFIHTESLTPEQKSPYLLGNLEPYEMYAVWMTASNRAGEGAVSLKINQTTSQGTPSAPQNVAVSKVTSKGFTVHWDAPEQTNGIIKHYIVKVNNTDQREVNSTETEINNLSGYTRYVVSVAACTEGHIDHACGTEASPKSFIQTLIGVPGAPSNLHSESKSSKSFTMLWSPPETPNGPIEHYSIMYHHQNMENETYQVKDTKYKIGVSCTATETLKYTFSVKAVNKDENDNLLPGPEVPGVYEFVCDTMEDPVVILYILVPSVIIMVFVLLTWIYKNKYHDKYFMKWPEPKIIQVVVNPELSPRPIEKERFDPLKKRPHSQSSNGSTASSDQGFHEMSLCLSQVELNTQEQKAHFTLNRSNIRSDSLTDDLEDDTFYPQEQNPRIENDNTCDSVSTCLGKKGQEYFHMNYMYMTEDAIQYQRLVLKGSQEALDFSPSNDQDIQKRSSESSDEVIEIDGSIPDIDPYIKVVPTSPTSQTSIQLTANEATNSDNYAHISSDIKSKEARDIESVIDIDSLGVQVQNGEGHQAPNEEFLSGDYVQSSNFRVLHQMSEELVDDGIDESSGCAINDYSQMDMPNLSDFLENISSNA